MDKKTEKRRLTDRKDMIELGSLYPASRAHNSQPATAFVTVNEFGAGRCWCSSSIATTSKAYHASISISKNDNNNSTMTSTSDKVYKVLLAGLDPKSVAAKVPAVNAEELGKELNASFAKLNAVSNLEITVCWLYLEDEKPAAPIAKALQESSFDGVLIGWGVRGLPENSPLFEQAVQAVRDNAPLSTKMIFSTTADDHLLTIRRNFPAVKESSQ